MIPRARTLYEDLESAKRALLATVSRLDEEQLHFRSSPSAWSVIQVVDHVGRAESGCVRSMRRCAGQLSARRSLRYTLGFKLLELVFRFGIRVKNPVPEAEPQLDPQPVEVLTTWDRTREDLHEFLDRLPEEGLGWGAIHHPLAGPFTVEECLQLLQRHLRHHSRQLERIRQEPGFPRQLTAVEPAGAKSRIQ